MEQGLMPWWGAGDIDSYMDYLVCALYNRICIITHRPTTCRASAHSNYIFWVGHLVIQSFKYRGHFTNDSSRNDDHITLAGSSPCNFATKSCPVVFGCRGTHHFNCTA